MTSTSAASPYALDNDNPTAANTLGCLSAILDDNTAYVLEDALLRMRGKRCLELGAGNGSVARWMWHNLSDPEVVAVDIKPQHVEVPDGVTVVGADVARDELPDGTWDLIHARLLLAHLPQRRDILRRCVDRLNPGGALVIEEWGLYGQSRILSEPGGLAASLYQQYTEALTAVFAEQGNDGTWCISVPSAMAGAGLVDVRTVAHAQSWKGGTAGCELPIGVSTELHDRLVAQGMAAIDLERMRARLSDPITVLVGNLTWSTTGFKPV